MFLSSSTSSLPHYLLLFTLSTFQNEKTMLLKIVNWMLSVKYYYFSRASGQSCVSNENPKMLIETNERCDSQRSKWTLFKAIENDEHRLISDQKQQKLLLIELESSGYFWLRSVRWIAIWVIHYMIEATFQIVYLFNWENWALNGDT